MGNFTGFQKSDDFYIHPCLGQIKRIQKEDGPQLIQHKIIVDSEDTVNKWISTITLLENNLTSSLLFLPKSHFYQRIGYCGGNCEVFLLYDDFMFCLKDEIINRRLIKRHLSESSVWQMLFKLVKAAYLLQKFKLKIGNVKTENILVNEEGDFRIVSQFSWPNDSERCFSDIELKQKLYSPEQLQSFSEKLLRRAKSLNLQKKNSRQSETPNEDQTFLTSSPEEQTNNEQIFSIGATLLQICTLLDSKQLYMRKDKDKVVNQVQISKLLASLQGKYSISLIGIIAQMLRINPEERPTASDIIDLLADHETAILKHQFFTLIPNFSEPFSNRLPNHTLDMEGKNILANSKQKGNKWGNLAVFFPFLRDLYEEKAINQVGRRNSSSELRRQLSLTKAH